MFFLPSIHRAGVTQAAFNPHRADRSLPSQRERSARCGLEVARVKSVKFALWMEGKKYISHSKNDWTMIGGAYATMISGQSWAD